MSQTCIVTVTNMKYWSYTGMTGISLLENTVLMTVIYKYIASMNLLRNSKCHISCLSA